MLKYNFVFLYATQDYVYSILGKELYNHPQVRIYKYAFDGPGYLQKIYHIHTAYSINEKIELPFKKVWFNRRYNQNFNNNLPICFVYLGGNLLRFDGEFIEYVRERNPNNKIVVLHWDLISKKIKYDYSIIRNMVDLAISYDLEEARKYKIHYFREDTYSKIIEPPELISYDADVYFLGAAKDRLKSILSTYNQLTKNGLKCKFLIAGVNKKDQYQAPGIEYIKGISYEENIRNVINSRCVLEIIQKGSVDITTRALEAIAYQRKFLTNCKTVPKDYFNKGQLQVFDNPEDIDCSLLLEKYDPEDYLPLYDMNPIRRLYDIQEQLEKLKK